MDGKDNGSDTDRKRVEVKDRRTFSGEPEGGARGEEESVQAGSGDDAPREEPPTGGGGAGRGIDFSTFLVSLFSSALIQLGEMPDPAGGEGGANLEAARQSIDILDMLRVKTAGNLSGEEEQFLSNAVAELKWKYIEAQKGKGQ